VETDTQACTVVAAEKTQPTSSPRGRAMRVPSPTDESSEGEMGILQQLADLQVCVIHPSATAFGRIQIESPIERFFFFNLFLVSFLNTHVRPRANGR